MNKPSEQNATNGTAKTADQTLRSGLNNGAPTFTKSERMADPKETAQEVVHQVTPKEVIKALFTQIPAKDAVNTPPLAARGDDDVTIPASQQQKHHEPAQRG